MKSLNSQESLSMSLNNQILFQWIINELKEVFLNGYQENTININEMKLIMEWNIDIFLDENFLIFMDQKIVESINKYENWKKDKESNLDIAFYQTLVKIFIFLYNKNSSKSLSAINELSWINESYKTRVSELIEWRLKQERIIHEKNQENEYYKWSIEKLYTTLAKYWIDWEYITIESVANKFYAFWRITKILNLNLPEMEITDKKVESSIEELIKWYNTMKLFIDSLIRKKILLRTNSKSFRINWAVLSVLKNEKILTQTYTETTTFTTNNSSNIIKSEDFETHTFQEFKLENIEPVNEEENELEKARKEIERLKKEVTKLSLERSDNELKIREANETNRKLLAFAKKQKREIEQIKKDLQKKWKTKAEIINAVNEYERNQK